MAGMYLFGKCNIEHNVGTFLRKSPLGPAADALRHHLGAHFGIIWALGVIFAKVWGSPCSVLLQLGLELPRNLLTGASLEGLRGRPPSWMEDMREDLEGRHEGRQGGKTLPHAPDTLLHRVSRLATHL